jgi:hypothetical protein
MNLDMVEFMPTLANQKQALLEKWLERTLATYPRQTLHFLHDEKDRFRNPVGHTLREGLATLLEEVTGEMDAARIRPALESIVRLRAVQDFTPSQAVGFIYLLREILDEELAGERSGGFTPPWRGEPAPTSGGTWAVQRRIDELALLAFDLFMQCREEIFEIKAREARRQTYVAERLARFPRGEGT